MFGQLDPSAWANLISTLGFPIFVTLASAWAFLAGKVHSASEVEARERSIARLEAQVDKFTEQYETVVLPTVNSALHAIQQATSIIESTTATTRDTKLSFERLEEVARRVEQMLIRLSAERP